MGNSTLLNNIELSKIDEILEILKQNPHLLNCNLSKDVHQTPIARAVWRNNIELVKNLINIGVDIDNGGTTSITPLMWACRRDNLIMVQYLIQNGAQICIKSNDNFNAFDYSILHGNYRPALFLYEYDQEIQDIEIYINYAKIHDYRYVNYQLFIEYLKNQTPYEQVTDIFIKQKKTYFDPVIDPRESWTQFIIRQIEFQNPPLIERNQLPEHLQPQNRFFGRIRQKLNRLPINKSNKYQLSDNQFIQDQSFV